jgi:hypothetical protein
MLCGPTADPEPGNYSVCYHRQGSIYILFTIVLFSAQDISYSCMLDFSSNSDSADLHLWFMVLAYD